MPISHPTIVFALAAALYTFPSLIAVALGRRHQWSVFAVNLATGWTGIGWIASLRWALAKNRPQRQRRERPLRRARSAAATPTKDENAAIERARFDENWADAAAAQDLYAQWLNAGAARRDAPAAATMPSARAANSDAPRRMFLGRRSRSVAPSSPAAVQETSRAA